MWSLLAIGPFATLLVLSIFDIKYRKIPNEIVYFIIFIKTLKNMMFNSLASNIKYLIFLVILFALILIFYKIMKIMRVNVAAGDLKLIALVIVLLGIDTGLEVAILSLLLSIMPLAIKGGKIPLAPFFLIGYIVYFVF